MSEESDGLYSESNIRSRYRYHTGRRAGRISTNDQFRTSFTGENEWYTPLVYIDAAREVMGTITLDPTTSEYEQDRRRDEAYRRAAKERLSTHPPAFKSTPIDLNISRGGGMSVFGTPGVSKYITEEYMPLHVTRIQRSSCCLKRYPENGQFGSVLILQKK